MNMNTNLRIAIQAKGRLNEKSMSLLQDAGINIEENSRKFLGLASNFPIEALFMRDDDIPQATALGAVDLGIVGYNEYLERGCDCEVIDRLGFGGCRISLAIPKSAKYTDLQYFNGKKIATSYPNILNRFFKEKGIKADVFFIAGSVEIAPSVGLGDAIFDIVSSGVTLVTNGLKEVEKVIESEAVLIANRNLSADKKAALERLDFRFKAVKASKGKKYVLMNLPNEKIGDVVALLPAMRSPTVLPLAQSGWSSLHTVIGEEDLWVKIEKLKELGAEGILVLSLEKMIQ